MVTSPSIDVQWLDYLRSNRVIKAEEYMQIVTMLDRKGTRSHAVAFMNRMRGEHPDLWIAFKSKMRVLGRL